MGKACDATRKNNDNMQRDYLDAFDARLEAQITKIFGQESDIVNIDSGNPPLDRKASSEWLKARRAVKSQLTRNSALFNYSNFAIENNTSYLKSLSSFMERTIPVSGGVRGIILSGGPRRVLSAARQINRIVSLQNSRFGKALNKLERALLPPDVFAFTIDSFGFLAKHINQARTLVEDSRTFSAVYKERHRTAMAAYIKSLREAIASVDIGDLDASFVLDGVETMDNEGNPIIFLGAVRDEGRIKLRVRNADGSGGVREVRRGTINESLLRDQIVDKVGYEFVDDLMNGQTRNIEWHDSVRTIKEGKAVVGKGTLAEEIESQRILILDKLETKARLLEEGKQSKDKEAQRKAEDVFRGIPNVHETVVGDKRYRYILISNKVRLSEGAPKVIVGSNQEKWYGIPIAISDVNTGRTELLFRKKPRPGEANPNSIENLRERTGLFRDGFYKSKKHRIYGFPVVGGTVETKRRERGWDFSDMGSLMLTPPNARLIAGRTEKGGPVLWETVASLRALYRDIGGVMSRLVQGEQEEIERWLGKNGKLSKSLREQFGVKDTQGILAKLEELYGFTNNLFVSKDGRVMTPNSFFNLMQEDYSPVMFSLPTTISMLEDTISEMETRFEIAETEKERKEIRVSILEFKTVLARVIENTKAETELAETLEADLSPFSKTVLGQKNVHFKKRQEWTDMARRIKSADVFDQYIDKLAYSMHKNSLMLSSLKTIDSVHKTTRGKASQEVTEFVITRTKIALNDPTAEDKIGDIDISYERVARWLNKFPGKKNHTPESAQTLLNNMKGWMGMMYLGAGGALTNRTQFVNPIIKFGVKTTQEAMRILNGKDPSFPPAVVNAIIDIVGTDEVTNMMMDMQAHGGNLKLNDAGFLDLPIIGNIPTVTFADFLIQRKLASKDNFDEFDVKQIDQRFADIVREKKERTIQDRIHLKTELARKNLSGKARIKLNKILASLTREERRLSNKTDKEVAMEAREAFLDLVLTPKQDLNRETLEFKLKRLIGDVGENRMGRMVAWKLSWWPEGFGAELFTFSESEKLMRRQVVIATLLAGARTGTLGDFDLKDTEKYTYTNQQGNLVTVDVPKVFTSKAAIDMARNAVANMMFGMSAIHLPDSFYGGGSLLGMWKGYSLQQMQHDWRILNTYMQGNEHWTDNVKRITKAMHEIMKRKKNNPNYVYDPNDSSIDPDAVAMARFITTRVAMSIFATLISMFGLFKFFFRAPFLTQINSMIRGGENPVIGIMTRLFANAAIMASMDDDEFEGSFLEISWDIARLIFPVFLTIPLNIITEMIDEN